VLFFYTEGLIVVAPIVALRLCWQSARIGCFVMSVLDGEYQTSTYEQVMLR
jgi:hypothetical protein